MMLMDIKDEGWKSFDVTGAVRDWVQSAGKKQPTHSSLFNHKKNNHQKKQKFKRDVDFIIYKTIA